MKVLVLGCGPAGLMATHAVAQAGHQFIVVSKRVEQSHLFGCQYLHSPIPGMTEEGPVRVKYQLTGTPDQYREKVYGPNSTVEVSPESLSAEHDAWDIRSTYDNLWKEYARDVLQGTVNSATLSEATKEWNPDFVISTVPAPALCAVPEHTFAVEKVWAAGDAPALGKKSPVRAPKNTVLLNGEKAPAWYRVANVFGHTTAEWPERTQPPYAGVTAVQKPLTTTCTCWPQVQRLGRYGQWKKGVLSHEAFFTTQDMLAGEGYVDG